MKNTLEDIMEKKHLHWDFLAYTSKEGQNFDGVVELSVTGYLSEDKALKAVKQIVERPFYYLKKVWECSHCSLQEKAVRTQAQMLEIMMKEHGKEK